MKTESTIDDMKPGDLGFVHELDGWWYGLVEVTNNHNSNRINDGDWFIYISLDEKTNKFKFLCKHGVCWNFNSRFGDDQESSLIVKLSQQ